MGSPGEFLVVAAAHPDVPAVVIVALGAHHVRLEIPAICRWSPSTPDPAASRTSWFQTVRRRRVSRFYPTVNPCYNAYCISNYTITTLVSAADTETVQRSCRIQGAYGARVFRNPAEIALSVQCNSVNAKGSTSSGRSPVQTRSTDDLPATDAATPSDNARPFIHSEQLYNVILSRDSPEVSPRRGD